MIWKFQVVFLNILFRNKLQIYVYIRDCFENDNVMKNQEHNMYIYV